MTKCEITIITQEEHKKFGKGMKNLVTWRTNTKISCLQYYPIPKTHTKSYDSQKFRGAYIGPQEYTL